MANKLTHTTTSSPNGINEVCSMITIDTVSNPFIFHNILLPTETDYVFTAYVKSSVAGSITVGGKTVNTTTSWAKKIITFTNTDTSNKNLQMSFGANGTYYFYHTKLETGSLSTHYSSAPQDNHDTLQHIQTVAEQTADGFKWLVNGSQETGFYISDGGIEAITEKFTIKGSDGTMTVINGGRIETGSIIGNDIKANSITARELTTGNITSADGNSWINFDKGTFSYGQGKLSWNGTNLNVEGVVKATSGEFNGTVNASTISASQGVFAGWTVCSDGLKRAGAATLAQNNITNTNKYDTSTYTNFWDSGWFNFNAIDKGQIGSSSSTTGTNTGDMYFGNNGLAITSNFTVSSAGYMKATSGSIGGFTLSSNKFEFSNTSDKISGYIASSGDNLIYLNKGDENTYDRFYVTKAGTIASEHQARESVSNENGGTETKVNFKRTLIGDGSVATTGFFLCGSKTGNYMDGNIGVRIHPLGTIHIEGNSSVIPQLYFTLNDPNNSTQANRWDGSIHVLSDKTFEIKARPTSNSGKGLIKLNSNTLTITGDTTASGTFTASGTLTANGALNAKSTLSVTGAITASNNLTVAGNIYVNGHGGFIGNIVTGHNSNGFNITGGSWATALTMELAAGTWVIVANVDFSEADSTGSNGCMSVCLASTAASKSNYLAGSFNEVIQPANGKQGYSVSVSGIVKLTATTKIYCNAFSSFTRNGNTAHYTICRVA